MKKIILVLFSLILVLLTSCAGVNDWTYVLPNGFEMWRINSDEIIIKYTADSTKDIGIPSFIKEFAYDEKYVLTRNIPSIKDNNIFNEEYYILDTEEQVLYGAFESLDDFMKELKEKEINIQNWYRTSPDPNVINSSEAEGQN